MIEATPEQIAAINAQKLEVLADWWCILNGWGWPDGLPGRPEGPRASPRSDAYNDTGFAVMSAIHGRIGFRACLRHHSVVRLKHMTDEEFGEWFDRGVWPKRMAPK